MKIILTRLKFYLGDIFLQIKYSMRRIIHYIRQCFCFHTFMREQSIILYNENKEEIGSKDIFICTKCLYKKVIHLK